MKKTQPTKEQKLIYEMLTSNTGIHMLDSGGSNGRHWQRNQVKTIQDFMSEPEVSYDPITNETLSNEIYFNVSVFHYLSRYELDATCEYFNNLDCPDWDSNIDIYGVSQGQLDKLASYVSDNEVSTFLDAMDENYIELERAYNTYNGECPLSQTLQGARVKINEQWYEFIQVHNGADVRGGYTDAKLFKYPDHTDFMTWDVCGSIDGVYVSTMYDGYSLLDDNNGQPVPVKKDSSINLYLTEY